MELNKEFYEDHYQAAASSEDIKQWVTFDLNKERYGIDVMAVKEVLRFSEVTEVPGSENFVKGIINLRGNVVTVIDTRKLFEIKEKESDEETRILVFELGNNQELAGLIIDNVEEVVTLNESDIDRKSNIGEGKKQKSFVQGLCYHEESLIILMDLAKIIEKITPKK